MAFCGGLGTSCHGSFFGVAVERSEIKHRIAALTFEIFTLFLLQSPTHLHLTLGTIVLLCLAFIVVAPWEEQFGN
ncbi:MAG: hypothetical protein EBZ48_08355 [Proteobacteria bacterium]|nr:hypothetical protein [Pseudomonadota bacterium]